MSALTQYVTGAKIDEVAEQLRRQGYQVQSGHRRGESPFDLIATKGDERLAVEVKALSDLRGRARELHDLRSRALREGFTEFRLIVANPPREKRIAVDGLDRALLTYLIDHVPLPLQSAASNILINSVSSLEVDAIHAMSEGTEVEGAGVLDVTLEYDGSRDGVASDDSFPFRFRALLSRDLRLERVIELDVDLASLADE